LGGVRGVKASTNFKGEALSVALLVTGQRGLGGSMKWLSRKLTAVSGIEGYD
jgi:hypothetical protein